MKITNDYIYVVIEHDTQEAVLNKKGEPRLKGKSAVVHGVYINSSEAEGKRYKLVVQGVKGYVAVLKKPLHGKSLFD